MIYLLYLVTKFPICSFTEIDILQIGKLIVSNVIPKNITSFLTLPHPLHSPIWAKDTMITSSDRGWEGWGMVHLC